MRAGDNRLTLSSFPEIFNSEGKSAEGEVNAADGATQKLPYFNFKSQELRQHLRKWFF